MSWSSPWLISFRFSCENPICIELRSHACCMLHPSYPPCLYAVFSSSFNLCSSLNMRETKFHTQNYRQKYSFQYHNLYVLKQQGRRQKFLNWIAASSSSINLLLISQLITYWFVSHSHMFELHTFKGSISCLCVMFLPCILVMRHQHVFSFFCVYF
jgi:hypothetical protein